jgi:hypothetical protein
VALGTVMAGEAVDQPAECRRPSPVAGRSLGFIPRLLHDAHATTPSRLPFRNAQE